MRGSLMETLYSRSLLRRTGRSACSKSFMVCSSRLPLGSTRLSIGHHLLEEAAPGARVAGWSLGVRLDQYRVVIAVNPYPAHAQEVARGLALGPEGLPGAAPERHHAGANGFLPRLWVHEADHQNLFGAVVLHDGGHQAALLLEIQTRFGVGYALVGLCHGTLISVCRAWLPNVFAHQCCLLPNRVG